MGSFGLKRESTASNCALVNEVSNGGAGVTLNASDPLDQQMLELAA